MNNIDEILDGLRSQDNYRELRTVRPDGKMIIYEGREYLNMSSNDYLGIGSDKLMQAEFLKGLSDEDRFLLGNPSSRLMTGNSPEYRDLEESMAGLYPGREVLVSGSGYLANIGILPALTGKDDVILADRLVHASLIDGLRLCGCEWRRFRHNDMDHLESILRKLSLKPGKVWVVTESVFSMDGDRAPLEELLRLKEKYGFRVYLDEAHAFGVFGDRGGGLASEAGLDGFADITVGTFGKAAASVGAFAVAEPRVKELLINRMRTLIYSTALAPISLVWTRFVVERFAEMAGLREHLRELIKIVSPDNPWATQIVPVMVYDNAEAGRSADKFREQGFWVTPIRYPTVPEGTARIRMSLNAGLSRGDVEKFLGVWKNIG